MLEGRSVRAARGGHGAFAYPDRQDASEPAKLGSGKVVVLEKIVQRRGRQLDLVDGRHCGREEALGEACERLSGPWAVVLRARTKGMIHASIFFLILLSISGVIGG